MSFVYQPKFQSIAPREFGTSQAAKRVDLVTEKYAETESRDMKQRQVLGAQFKSSQQFSNKQAGNIDLYQKDLFEFNEQPESDFIKSAKQNASDVQQRIEELLKEKNQLLNNQTIGKMPNSQKQIYAQNQFSDFQFPQVHLEELEALKNEQYQQLKEIEQEFYSQKNFQLNQKQQGKRQIKQQKVPQINEEQRKQLRNLNYFPQINYRDLKRVLTSTGNQNRGTKSNQVKVVRQQSLSNQQVRNKKIQVKMAHPKDMKFQNQFRT